MADTDQNRRNGQSSGTAAQTPQTPLRAQPQQPPSMASGRPTVPAPGAPASAPGAGPVGPQVPRVPQGQAASGSSPAGSSSDGTQARESSASEAGSAHDGAGLRDKVEEDWEAMRKAAGAQFSRATDKVSQTADRQRDFAADQISSVARAIDRAGSELESEDHRDLGRVTRQLGDSVQRLADEMKGRSLSEMAAMAEDFGRRQPLAFLGLAAFAGLAASRFAGASASRQPSMEPRSTRAGGTRPQGATAGTVPTSATTQPSARSAAGTGTTPGAHHG